MPIYNPAHPGLVLKDALEGANMTVTQFAGHIGVSRVTLSRVVNCRAGVTPEMSIKISQAFGQPSGDLWFKMQNAYDFWQASHKKQKPVRPLKLKVAA
ncbi:HigA family addiction module antidote protein [Granulicella sp. 5B5]|uniref:HigA family addiction module antitoxin n=1 Tax=Granulicella sp. 5B5 TaxID=1617967 RepID=UPI0015F4955A|nr:HigA family addiction module antitoxin [Granulicella sp. 5B5]QMV18455.1 HigA family addiction module antidote protein [Granulicella sp. 5B5]